MRARERTEAEKFAGHHFILLTIPNQVFQPIHRESSTEYPCQETPRRESSRKRRVALCTGCKSGGAHYQALERSG